MNILYRPTTSPNEESRVFDPHRALRDLLRIDACDEPVDAEAFQLNPAFEETETGDGYQLRAIVPGLTERNLEITVSGLQLTIAGHREADRRRETPRFYLYEHSYSTFGRSFALPAGVDGRLVTASLDGDVLTVVVPRCGEMPSPDEVHPLREGM